MRWGAWPFGLRPNFVIGGADNPYLRRWWIVPRNKWFNVYLHHFLRSDDDSALHDHPWWNISILLAGAYIEHTPSGSVVRRPWRPVFRRAAAAHRIELLRDTLAAWSGPDDVSQWMEAREHPVWTLFVTGPKTREWGFWCPRGWRHWRDFTSADGATIGRGCDD